MKKIAIIPNTKKDADLKSTKRILDILEKKVHVLMCDKYQASGMNAEYMPYNNLFDEAECMVTLGGDGTILQIAAPCARRGIPVLGINLGKVGFLTEIELDNIEYALSRLADGDYGIEKRMMMNVKIHKAGGMITSTHALNDVVVSKNAGAKLINLELSAGNEPVNSYIADGLIIATPTGSTGYSISAGGPVVDPGMSLFVATPICAHTLSVRSAVLPCEKEIIISLSNEYPDNSAVVSADGDIQCEVSSRDRIIITKSDYEFSIIKIGTYSFYNTVLKKLS